MTHKDAFPLPRIEDSLTSLTRAEWYTTFDLASGYWRVELEEGDEEKTAFTTPLGLFQFERVPLGLCNAPATFQRLMQRCLGNQLTESALVYLDDVVIFSPRFCNTSAPSRDSVPVPGRLWLEAQAGKVPEDGLLVGVVMAPGTPAEAVPTGWGWDPNRWRELRGQDATLGLVREYLRRGW